MIRILRIVVYEDGESKNLYNKSGLNIALQNKSDVTKFREHFVNMYFKGKNIDVTFKDLNKKIN